MSLRRTLATLAGSSALAVTSTLAVTATLPASAQTIAANDARGDVTAINERGRQAVDETVRNGDVLRTVFRHSGRRITVRARFADLTRQGDVRQDFVQLVTNERQRRYVILMAGEGMWRGEAMMMRGNGRDVKCRIRHRIDYADNVVTMSFPRSCASHPRWVRIGLGSAWGGPKTWYGDDALRRGPVGDNLAMSPRIRRG